ncbi:MAG: endonuclease/exonuclease/phosphatase family protein [Bacteroidaceae bacterium]|nr:endonuclease/exonuclease/phosphatase family protein [Bacteroidaceae bacterium]
MKIIKTLAVQLCTGVNIATILMLWFCCLATYVNPSDYPRLSLLPLVFPLFLIVDVAFIVFWVIFKISRVWLPLVGLAACLNFVRAYCPVNPSFLQAADTTASLRVITYNTRSFGGSAARDEAGNNSVANFIYFSEADIICLQESSGGGANLSTVREKMEEMGYQCFEQKGNVLFSRLPILDADSLSFPTRSNGGFFAHLQYGCDTILLINNHFESNHLTEIIKDGYRDAIEKNALGAHHREVRDTLRKELGPMINLLCEAAPLRAAQADTIHKMVEDWLPRPVIVCGDFNDTPVSYALRLLTSHLQSAFTQSGNGVGFTFHDRGFPVRIDHILYSGDHWRSRQTKVEKTISASDHFPISTKLVRK